MADSIEEIKNTQRKYMVVGAALFVGTLLTVAVATWPPLEKLIGGHGFDTWDMTIGLLIATAKVSLVMYFFMHLNHEKPWVYWLFGFGIVGAIALAALLFLAKFDPIYWDKFNTGLLLLPV